MNRDIPPPSPFPFPDLLPPSSELPLLDVEMGDLTGFGEEIPGLGEDWRISSQEHEQAEYFNENQDQINKRLNVIHSNQIPERRRLDQERVILSNRGGLFSDLLRDDPDINSTKNCLNSFMDEQQGKALGPFNVFLSGHDYTKKIEGVGLPPHFNTNTQPQLLQHQQQLQPPHMTQLHQHQPSIIQYIHHPHHHQRPQPHIPPPAPPPIYRSPLYQQHVIGEKLCANRSETKEDERLFQCSYANCGKVYAKSSHLKVLH